ncbi:ABC transporter ATP-binding protein [Eubacteriaceae bacterium ES3]|nr:ABC transporter ATP-binding protein [Eubacteriaceae bacterium ES3]
MKAVISIKGLSKAYNNKVVLKDIDMKIMPGELICIVGSSGCGKTTLLNLVGGFIKAEHGEILLDGYKIEKPSRQCIMVFQEFDQLFPWKTVRKNVEFPLEKIKTRYTKEEIRESVSHYLKLVKLSDYDTYYPSQLSGGMKQRTALARALALTPKVLLMDEPFGSLDAQTKRELQDNLLEIKEATKTTVLFVTHDIREAMILADRIVVLNSGKIMEIINNSPKNVSQELENRITDLLSL